MACWKINIKNSEGWTDEKKTHLRELESEEFPVTEIPSYQTPEFSLEGYKLFSKHVVRNYYLDFSKNLLATAKLACFI